MRRRKNGRKRQLSQVFHTNANWDAEFRIAGTARKVSYNPKTELEHDYIAVIFGHSCWNYFIVASGVNWLFESRLVARENHTCDRI